MDLDIERAIETEVESWFNFDHDMHAFDISDVKVEILEFKPRNVNMKPARLKVIDVIDKINCSTVEQTSSFPEYSETHNESFAVTFEGKISFGTSVTAELGLPNGLSVGGESSRTIDLGASATHEFSSSTTVTHAGNPVVIPPCSRVRATREIWAIKASGQIEVKVRIHGRVSYEASSGSSLWPDPNFTNEVDFIETLTGTFTGVSGFEIRGVTNQSGAQCDPPCKQSTSTACRLDVGTPRVAVASQAYAALGFRSKVTLEGVQGAVIGQPFPIESHPGAALVLSVAVLPKLEGFDEIVGKTSVRVPLLPHAGYQKLQVPVTCRVPGELVGSTDAYVTVMVMQPVRVAMLEG